MLLNDFVKKASKLTVIKATNGEYYLDPLWFITLKEHKLDTEDISNFDVSMDSLFEILKLEVVKQNTIHSKQKMVTDWLYDLATAQIDPAITQEENEFIKQATNFMIESHKSQEEAIK